MEALGIGLRRWSPTRAEHALRRRTGHAHERRHLLQSTLDVHVRVARTVLAFTANKWLPIVLAALRCAANAARESLRRSKKKTTPPDRSTGGVEMAAGAPYVNIDVEVENSAEADGQWLKSFIARALAD